MSATKYTVMYSVLLLLLISITLLSFFGWKGLHSFEDETSYKLGQEITNNWEQPMVTGLVLATGSSCPSGYTQIHQKVWPGTVETCSCPYQVGFGNFFNITAGACTSAQLNNNCITNIARDAVEFNLWKNSKIICSRLGSTSFKDASEKCTNLTSHKVCNAGESEVCIPVGETCPISYAKVSSAPEASLSTLQLDTGVHLSFGHKDDHFPIASFHSSEESFCAFTSEKNLGSGNYIYKFLKSKDNKACLTDPNYLVVDTIGEEDYFKVNNFYTSVLQIPGYPRPSNDNPFSIGARSSYKWDKKCRHTHDYNLATATSILELHETKRVALIIAITTLVVLIVSGILVPGLHYVIFRYDLDGGKKNTLRNSIIFVDQVGKLAILATLIMGVYFIYSNLNWLFYVIDNGCSDDFVKDQVLEAYVEKMKTIANLYTWALVLISIIVLHDLGYVVYLIRFSKKDEYAEKSKRERDLKTAKKSASKKPAKKVATSEKNAVVDSNPTITDEEQGKQNTENPLISQEEEIEGEKKDQDFLDDLKESINKVGDNISKFFNFGDGGDKQEGGDNPEEGNQDGENK